MPEGRGLFNISLPERSPITRSLYNFACYKDFFLPPEMSKWLQFNKTAFGEQINFHFDDKWNFSFHLIICKSLGGAEAAGCVSQKTFFLQVRLASVCSHDCTSTDMFPLLCLSGHKFKTGYSSGAASQWGKQALSPAELYPSPIPIPIPFPSSGATDILPLSAAALGAKPLLIREN